MSVTVRGSLSTKREETLQTLQKYTSISLLHQLITARSELDTQALSELLSSHSRSPQVQPEAAQGLSRVPGAARRSRPAAQVRGLRGARLPSGAARPSRAAPAAPRDSRAPLAQPRTCCRRAALSRALPASPRAARLTHAGARDVQGAGPAPRERRRVPAWDKTGRDGSDTCVCVRKYSRRKQGARGRSTRDR